jgi:hypothetical protein
MKHSAIFLNALCAFAVSFTAFSGEADKPAEAKAAFEAAYEKGTAAAGEKRWAEAEKNFEAALKALGEEAHPKKAVAQVLLTKSRENAKAQEQDEVRRKEAAAALAKAKAEADEELKKAEEKAAARKKEEAEAERKTAAEAEKKAADAEAARKKEDAAKTAAKPDAPAAKAETKNDEPVKLPDPVALDRDEWQKGSGSSCYWSGARLYLEEGDEFFKKVLRKDFAVTIQLEARMDEQSRISIELRPEKGSDARTRIIGWGSKEGSAPMLMLDKDTKARGESRPESEQIMLSFVRREKKIDFFCNGKLVGTTWDARLGQPYTLYVCGKGIMDGAKIVEK